MDPAKAKSRAIYKHDGAYYAVALDRKQGRLYAGGTDYAIHVFDLPRDQATDHNGPGNEAQKKDAKPTDAKAAGAKAATTKSADVKADSSKAKAGSAAA